MEELPSISDVANTDDIELQEITENASRSIENLIKQLQEESSEDFPMRELLGLDKQLGSIRGLLRVVEVVSKKSISSRKSETIQIKATGFEKTFSTESPR